LRTVEEEIVLDSLLAKYVWVNRIEGWTVAMMRQRPAEEVVRICGGEHAEPMGELAFADMDHHRSSDVSYVEFFVQMRPGMAGEDALPVTVVEPWPASEIAIVMTGVDVEYVNYARGVLDQRDVLRPSGFADEHVGSAAQAVRRDIDRCRQGPHTEVRCRSG
jgi:hypothetical protein